MKIKLKVMQAKRSDIRRGWIRIHENNRRYIKPGSLALIKFEDRQIRRIIYGPTTKTHEPDYIAMDEPTRMKLGISSSIMDQDLEFDIKEYRGLRGKFASIAYHWDHPDYSLSFSTKVAIILGGLSLIISIIGLGISLA